MRQTFYNKFLTFSNFQSTLLDKLLLQPDFPCKPKRVTPFSVQRLSPQMKVEEWYELLQLIFINCPQSDPAKQLLMVTNIYIAKRTLFSFFCQLYILTCILFLCCLRGLYVFFFNVIIALVLIGVLWLPSSAQASLAQSPAWG